MTVDLTNPQSIVAWWRVNPKRHAPQLAFFERYPDFQPALAEAIRIIKAERRS